MISLAGRLVVKIINGRHGEFRVGCLQTEIGEFAVKDRALDQYDEGCYEGVFGISKIFSSSYSASNRLVVEVRAVLDSIALANINVTEQDKSDSLEQDPLDEENALSDRHKPVGLDSDKAEKVTHENKDDECLSDQADQPDQAGQEESDEALFGDQLWPLADFIKLDPTVDRELFRRQRDRLKSLGYQFKPVGQSWAKV